MRRRAKDTVGLCDRKLQLIARENKNNITILLK